MILLQSSVSVIDKLTTSCAELMFCFIHMFVFNTFASVCCRLNFGVIFR